MTPPLRFENDPNRVARLSRRELLKLSPVLLMGAFAVRALREPLLRGGVSFADWAAGQTFRGRHPAQTFSDSELTPLERFPFNSYDRNDPHVDLDRWTLRVSGLVDKPGDYTLDRIQALPRVVQNTRHICVEGWDAIGNFGGARLAEFLALIGSHPDARFVIVECADDYYES